MKIYYLLLYCNQGHEINFYFFVIRHSCFVRKIYYFLFMMMLLNYDFGVGLFGKKGFGAWEACMIVGGQVGRKVRIGAVFWAVVRIHGFLIDFVDIFSIILDPCH